MRRRSQQEGVATESPRNEPGFSFSRFADGFDRHIRQSIRGYDDLLADCVALSPYFVEDDTTVFDIGCSTGTFLHEIWRANGERCARANFIGIDIEENFGPHWRRQSGDRLTLQVADVRSFPIPPRCSLVTSVFALQFIPECDRQPVLERIHRSLLPGGALIVAEKTFARSAKIDEMLSSVHYDFKRDSFSESELRDKARSLRSIMKLWSEDRLVEALTAAGFALTNVQPFWRNHAFAAYLALR